MTIGLALGLNQGLSPRGRGKPADMLLPCCPFRSIPAWAGETDCACGCRHRPWVYPRVGGGNDALTIALTPDSGLSPRGRGKRLHGRAEL